MKFVLQSLGMLLTLFGGLSFALRNSYKNKLTAMLGESEGTVLVLCIIVGIALIASSLIMPKYMAQHDHDDEEEEE